MSADLHTVYRCPSNGRDDGFVCRSLLQKLDVKTNGHHEEVDAVKTLFRHIGRQSLRDADSIHDTILHSQNQSLLFFGVRVDAEGGEELPHIDILSGSHSAREDVRQCVLESIEEMVKGSSPRLVLAGEIVSREERR